MDALAWFKVNMCHACVCVCVQDQDEIDPYAYDPLELLKGVDEDVVQTGEERGQWGV